MACPVCKQDDPDLEHRFDSDNRRHHFACPRCGDFMIGQWLDLLIEEKAPNHLLSGAIRNIKEQEGEPPFIDGDKIRA